MEGKTPTPQDLKRSFFRDPAKDISAAAAAESWIAVVGRKPAGHMPAAGHWIDVPAGHMSAAED